MKPISRGVTTIATLLTLGSLAACGGAGAEPTPEPAPPPAPPQETPVEPPVDTVDVPEEMPAEAEASVSPVSGEPGTAVAFEASGLTPGAMVSIGFGPPQSEYEVLDSMEADAHGLLRTTVHVPDWAEAGREYVFVADGPASLAVASFIVTAAEPPPERVEVTGMLTDEGVECPALRSDDGELYTLAGSTGEFTVGDRVTVEGTIAETSMCMQGTTIQVEEIRAGGGAVQKSM